ncbi:MAG: hypothetical protein A3J38_01685 [Gammaproteobacteria bacterium RIFCSPHIGHO2_12_FULL_45_9]|nr:MAG: hypothetical protein A3J38_01685 [Gammaproteobacteria bacterium RIFCSPHIGHO2_12_FULL_45_9]
MYADLPDAIQRVVREYLLANNFPAAKAIHDQWHKQQKQVKSSITTPWIRTLCTMPLHLQIIMAPAN